MLQYDVFLRERIHRARQFVGPQDHLAFHPVMQLSTIKLIEIDGLEVEELVGELTHCVRIAW